MNTENLYTQWTGYLSIVFNAMYKNGSFLGADEIIGQTFPPHDDLTLIREDVYYYFLKDVMDNLVDGHDREFISHHAKTAIETLGLVPPKDYDSDLIACIWDCMRSYFNDFSEDDFCTTAFARIPETYRPENVSELRTWFDRLNPPTFFGEIEETPQQEPIDFDAQEDVLDFDEAHLEKLFSKAAQNAPSTEPERVVSLDDYKVEEEKEPNLDNVYVHWIGYISLVLNTLCNESYLHAFNMLDGKFPPYDELNTIKKDVHFEFIHEVMQGLLGKEPVDTIREKAQYAMQSLEQTQPENYDRSIVRCMWNMLDGFLDDFHPRMMANYARIAIPYDYRPLDNGELVDWLDDLNGSRFNARFYRLNDDED